MSSPATVTVAEVAARVGTLLRAAGLAVTPERAARFAAALQAALPATETELYWVARVTLVGDRGELDAFDRVFAQLLGGLVDPADFRGDRPSPAQVRAGQPRRGDGVGEVAASSGSVSAASVDQDEDGSGPERPMVTASGQERLRQQDFADLSEHELREVQRLVAQLRVAPPLRAGRRHVAARHGDRLDVRATLGRAHRTGGDPHRLARRRPRDRPRRLVLLCDVSGSMEAYARVYLQLLHAAVRGCRAEAFVFGTRLTRVTGALATRSPDLALQRAGRLAPDWSGGTRIGAALRRFLDDHGRRGMARGAVVVIVSDGWERDDPDELGEQTARLSRLTHRLVWVNPRAAGAGYAPLVAGMAAARPHVDVFVPGNTLAALDDVVAAIAAP